jgi:hypothetical protein
VTDLSRINTGDFVTITDAEGNKAHGRVTRYRLQHTQQLSLWCFNSAIQFATSDEDGWHTSTGLVVRKDES